ncbi:17338_t:CDS:2 [Acaulospora morrowiae]|uniref:17338_t:CDS:1 n=1 Tax=Acaulospora morrowiae TaxID=94023 RepID=A0A9N9G5I0_9GLOM|nr:17338_t:CDS:2 [Acaulospora morrowiae]
MTLNAENTTFSIAGRGLKLDTAEDAQEFVDSILSQENLEKVILSGNTFGVEAAQAIAKALEQKKTLKARKIFVFDASDIFTGRLREEIPHAVKALCNSLEDKQLVELNFSDNAFGPAGVEPMVDFLTNNRSLKILKLNNNGLGPSGGKLIAKALLRAAEKNAVEGRESSLTTIIAGRNRLENGSSQVLADAIAAHGTLTEIRIPQNGIRSEGIVALSKGLAACKNLQVLDLQDNTFTESGSRAFAKALVEWPKLKLLNIGDCLLSADGGVIIAETLLLGHNKDLEHLNLQYNEINSKGVSILASAVSSHLKNLEFLELNGNCVNPEDVNSQEVHVEREIQDSVIEIKSQEIKIQEEDHGIQKTVVEVNQEIHESVREKDKSMLKDTADAGQPSIPAGQTSLKDVANDNNIREAIPEVKLQEVDREIHEGDRGISENTTANEQVEALTERVSRCHYL